MEIFSKCMVDIDHPMLIDIVVVNHIVHQANDNRDDHPMDLYM